MKIAKAQLRVNGLAVHVSTDAGAAVEVQITDTPQGFTARVVTPSPEVRMTEGQRARLRELVEGRASRVLGATDLEWITSPHIQLEGVHR